MKNLREGIRRKELWVNSKPHTDPYKVTGCCDSVLVSSLPSLLEVVDSRRSPLHRGLRWPPAQAVKEETHDWLPRLPSSAQQKPVVLLLQSLDPLNYQLQSCGNSTRSRWRIQQIDSRWALWYNQMGC